MKKGLIGFGAFMVILIVGLFLTNGISVKDPSKTPVSSPSAAPDIPEAAERSPDVVIPEEPERGPNGPAKSGERKESQGKDGHYAFAAINEMPDRIYGSGKVSPSTLAMDPAEVKKAIRVATETYMDLTDSFLWNSPRDSKKDAQYFAEIVGERGTKSLTMTNQAVVNQSGYLRSPMFQTMPGDGKILVNNEVYTSAFTEPRKSFNPPSVSDQNGKRIIVSGHSMYEIDVYDSQNNLKTLMLDGDYGISMVQDETGEWKVDLVTYESFSETIK